MYMKFEEKYPVLIGHADDGSTARLHSIKEVAAYICNKGLYGDVRIFQENGTPFLDTFGIYINRISDMQYREELLKQLIPMQQELDGTAEILGDKSSEISPQKEQNKKKNKEYER